MKKGNVNVYKRAVCFIRPIERGNEYWQRAIKGYGFVTEVPYIERNLVWRAAREAWFKLGLPKEIWFNKAIDDIDANVIIVKDVQICKEYLEWLRERKPVARIILDYDNRVCNSIDPNAVKAIDIEKWTYDPDDAARYNMALKEPAYMDCFRISEERREKAKKYDIVYVGRDKGRADYLFSLEEVFQKLGLSTYFHISPTHRYQLALKRYYRPVIRYEEYLELINKSTAILNIMPDNQKALTMRDFEAVYNGIKCITNNKAIRDFKLYEKSRFFIIGEDRMEDLPSFISAEFKPINEKRLEKYGFCSSLEKMINKR